MKKKIKIRKEISFSTLIVVTDIFSRNIQAVSIMHF